MNRSVTLPTLRRLPAILFSGITLTLAAQEPLVFTSIGVQTNREVRLQLSASNGLVYRIETSATLSNWLPLVTLIGAGGGLSHTDSAAPLLSQRFYRASQLEPSSAVTGDHLVADHSMVTIHPVNHATLVLTWNTNTIYVDPVGGAARFQGLPKPDLILVTHEHSDHMDAATINSVKKTNSLIVATRTVYQNLPTLRSQITVLTNGASLDTLNMTIRAVPAYNLTSTWHAKGVGNGYILAIDGRNIYISGDTEDTPELRALTGIDVAFLSINLPYTMTVPKAADAVRQFRPRVAYPYHYRNSDSRYSDLNQFKQLVGTDVGVEVRLRNWY